MGADSGREAVGQSGEGQGVDAGGPRIAHAQVLHDELAVAQLQSGLQRGCKECMPSFYAPTCVKNIGRETVPQQGRRPSLARSASKGRPLLALRANERVFLGGRPSSASALAPLTSYNGA